MAKNRTCSCVYRGVFRVCLGAIRARDVPALGWRPFARSAEYAADFQLAAKAALNDEEYAALRFYFFCDLEWKDCCRLLRLDRGAFFHLVYRVEQKVGRALIERPCLFPPQAYFSGLHTAEFHGTSAPLEKTFDDLEPAHAPVYEPPQRKRIRVPLRALAKAA